MDNDGSRLDRLVTGAMDELASERPLFQSEADFQLALAWTIQKRHEGARLRLEQRLLHNPAVVVDIVVGLGDQTYALELKYLKSRLAVTIDDERFELATGAPDVERYDWLKDIARLERLIDSDVADAGCAVLLTNAPAFWSPSVTGKPTGYDSFRIHGGLMLSGVLAWGHTAGAGTRRGREAPIELAGSIHATGARTRE